MRETKTAKKLAAVLMLVSFIFATVSPAMAGGLAKITDIAGGKGGTTGNAGTIYFGSYWQSFADGYSSSSTYDNPDEFNKNNYNKEGIKWRVLSNADGKTFLMSDQGLYADQFNSSTAMGNTWCTSEIRATMNNQTATTFGTDGNVTAWGGFAGDAFSAKEYAAIAATTHTENGATSDDKIFLLSKEEAMNTDYGFTNSTGITATRQMKATNMAKHVKMYGNSTAAYGYDIGNAYWWLRSPGDNDNYAYNVNYNGRVGGYGVNYDGSAARSALNLNQESVLLLSAAVGGKGADACVGAFGLADYAGADGWKLTLKDAYNETNNPTGIKAPTNVSVTQEKETAEEKFTKMADTAAAQAEGSRVMDLTNGYKYGWLNPKVSYNGKDAGADYVSAIAADGDGNYVNYAKISSQTDETNKELDINGANSTLADGEYKMYVYAEKIGKDANGNTDYQTDYASELSSGFTIHKGGEDKNEGVLAKDYADKGLTANLGGDFNLSFENDTYDTGVTVGANDNGTITADATNGTTLTGDISVGTGATLTTANTFTLGGAISGAGTIENTGTLNVNGTLAETATINNGQVNLGAGVEFTGGNFTNSTGLDFNNSIYNFSATLNSADPYITADDKITVNGNATGTIKLGTITLNGTSSDGWTVGTTEEMQYLNATGTDTNLTVAGYKVQTNTGYKYTFSQSVDSTSGNPNYGYMSVLKESEAELTLKDLVNNTSPAAGGTNQYTVDGLDDTTTEDLGALDNTLRGGKFAIVGSNGDPTTDILDGNGNGGIIVADTTAGGAAGDELTLKDITVQNFTPAVTNKEGGIVNLDNVIFSDNELWDIVNEGTVNLTGTNEFDKGISGADGALKGTVTAEDGAAIKGQGVNDSVINTETLTPAGDITVTDITINVAGATTAADGAEYTGNGEETAVINTDTLNGNGDLTVKDITINVKGDGGDIAGNLTLEDMTITGAGVDVTEETAGGLDLSGDVTVEDITITTGGDTAIADGSTITGNGVDDAVINTGTLTPAGDITVSDITINVTGATTAADGAEYTGNGEETAVINTDTLNGNGDLTAKDVTINVTGNGGDIAGELTLEDMTITGAGVDVTEETVGGLDLSGDVTVKDITITTDGDTNISDGGTVTGNGKDTAVINTDTLTGEGNAEVKDITINVNDKLDAEKDLTVTDADINVKGDIEIGGNVSITGTEDDHAKINFDGEGTIGGNVALDNGELNGGKLDINGNLDTKGGSSISGDITLNGDFNVNETTTINGKFTPKGNVNFNLDGEEKGNGYVFIDNTAAAEPMDLSNAIVNLIQTDTYYKLAEGESMTLITKAKNYMGDPEVQTREGVKKYLYSVGLDASSALMLGCIDQGAADQTKSFSEARLAGSAAINSASDLVASVVMENAKAESKDWEAFAAIQGSHSRYETGSHIDLNSTNVAAGLS
ncbi:MAG: hypothetical protein KBS54_07230, partial [Synergistaceae bacterium]|nr:hypothetical protein [Candidatus Equadaptatus faecalis]